MKRFAAALLLLSLFMVGRTEDKPTPKKTTTSGGTASTSTPSPEMPKK